MDKDEIILAQQKRIIELDAIIKNMECKKGSTYKGAEYIQKKETFTIEDLERCIEHWGLCKVEKQHILKFLRKK